MVHLWLCVLNYQTHCWQEITSILIRHQWEPNAPIQLYTADAWNNFPQISFWFHTFQILYLLHYQYIFTTRHHRTYSCSYINSSPEPLRYNVRSVSTACRSHSYTGPASSILTICVMDCEPHNYISLNKNKCIPNSTF